MLSHSLAALRTALADGHLTAWLAALPEPARAPIHRALTLDRLLLREHPDSLASCLLARTHGDAPCVGLAAAWQRELAAGDTPWIEPLRAVPVAPGLIAELHERDDLALPGLHNVSFASDADIVVVANRFHPDVQDPALRRRDRLRWSWARDEAVLEPDPHADDPGPRERFPRFESDGWGPVHLVRSPGATRITLPCPEDGSADARFTADGTRLIVYGTLDEYAGGFVWIVDPGTLSIERRLDTSSPVSAVIGHAPERLVVTTYRSGTIAWIDGEARQVALSGRSLALSPDGAHVASLDGGLRVWSLAELLRAPVAAPRAGFPPRFDPDGLRLLCDRQLLDARTGLPIAHLDPDLSPYLEGGPAQPWLHLGTRNLICSHGGLQIWDTRSGARRKPRHRLGFPHWYCLAYDRSGQHLAVLHQGETEVALHTLPNGRLLRTVRFELAGQAIAMSTDAGMIAVQQGAAIEVRGADGSLLQRLGRAATTPARRHFGEPTLRFSADGQRIACLVAGDEWWVVSLASGADERVTDAGFAALPDFASPRPRDWTIAGRTRSLFTHAPTSTRIALPVSGPWICNPADPRIVACDELHAVLHAP